MKLSSKEIKEKFKELIRFVDVIDVEQATKRINEFYEIARNEGYDAGWDISKN